MANRLTDEERLKKQAKEREQFANTIADNKQEKPISKKGKKPKDNGGQNNLHSES